MTRVTPDGTWKYSRQVNLDQYGAISYYVVTVTDPQNNQTVSNFSSNKFEMQRQVYSGSATGTPLENIITCYGGQSSPSSCTTQQYAQPGSEITTYTSFNGGPYSEIDTKLNSYNLPTERDEYDFGASTPTKKTSITYASVGNGANDRPSVVKVTDGAGISSQKRTIFTTRT